MHVCPSPALGGNTHDRVTQDDEQLANDKLVCYVDPGMADGRHGGEPACYDLGDG